MTGVHVCACIYVVFSVVLVTEDRFACVSILLHSPKAKAQTIFVETVHLDLCNAITSYTKQEFYLLAVEENSACNDLHNM